MSKKFFFFWSSLALYYQLLGGHGAQSRPSITICSIEGEVAHALRCVPAFLVERNDMFLFFHLPGLLHTYKRNRAKGSLLLWTRIHWRASTKQERSREEWGRERTCDISAQRWGLVPQPPAQWGRKSDPSAPLALQTTLAAVNVLGRHTTI